MSKWYGSINNRIDENKMFCDEIKVGTGVTKYSWSDRTPYEVIKVYDQQHVVIRMLDHVHVGNGEMDNNWKLVSNTKNPAHELKQRNGIWYEVYDVSKELFLKNAQRMSGSDTSPKLLTVNYNYIVAMACLTPKQKEKLEAGGIIHKSRKFGNISFGVAEYYYDYSF